MERRNTDSTAILISNLISRMECRDFPGGPVAGSLPSNAGDTGSIPGRGTKIPHATGQLSSHTTTREKHTCHN